MDVCRCKNLKNFTIAYKATPRYASTYSPIIFLIIALSIPPPAKSKRSSYPSKSSNSSLGKEIKLLSDTNFQVCEKFGVYGEKKFMGRKYMGISRVTYILDKNKKVIQI